MTPPAHKPQTSNRFIITRLFDAPRMLVWQAFTEADRLMRWWGPKGFRMIHATVDLRPGGLFHYGMLAPDGSEMWGKWTFREIVAPERLVLISSFSDKDGGLSRHPMAPTWPQQMLGTTTISQQGDSTLLTNTAEAHEASAEEIATFNAGFESMKQGFSGTWDQLEAYLGTSS